MEGEIQTCTNALITWITSGSLISWLKGISLLAVVAAAIATAIAAWTAVSSLKAQLMQSNASFLLQLSIRFNEMDIARNTVGDLKRLIMHKIKEEHGDLDDESKSAELRTFYCSEMRKIRDGKHHKYGVDDYKEIIKLCSFFEIVGLMTKKKYVSIDDIIEWIRGPIEDFEIMFSHHIAEREKEFGTPPGLFGNALWLAKNVTKKVG